MKSAAALQVVHRMHALVSAALWALFVAVVLWLMLNLPNIMEARQRMERQLARELADENRLYCEKWGMPAGTHEHVLCVMDLQEIRARQEQRLADMYAF
jgi:hypothetical protein